MRYVAKMHVGPTTAKAFWFEGCDMGGRLELIEHVGPEKLVVFFQPGHHYFGGQGQPRPYAPARFVVWRYDRLRWSRKDVYLATMESSVGPSGVVRWNAVGWRGTP